MNKLTQTDIYPNPEYERIRDDYRRGIIEYKKDRRIALGPRVTFVFENTKTMKFQVQEILRAEGLTTPEAIAGELAVYNALLPGEDELKATMLIEFSTTKNVREEMDDLLGLTGGIYLEVGPHRIRAEFEGGRETEQRISAVQYATFAFDADAKEAFVSGAHPVHLVSAHPRYEHRVQLLEGVRSSLAEDLGSRSGRGPTA